MHHHQVEPVPAEVRLQVIHETDHEEIISLLGPIALPSGGNTMRITPARTFIVPMDGWLTGFRARVLDARGRKLPDAILHHVNIVRPNRRELFMPVMQRLVAAGQETEEIGIPFPFGVPVSEGDTLLIVAMVHNPTGNPLEVMVEARLEYDTPAWLDRLGVQPFHLDIRPPPRAASFDLPPGRSEVTWEGSPAIDVKVIGVGGHLHEYAKELRLEEIQPDGRPRVLWRAQPALRPDGKVEGVPRKTFLLRLGLALSKDRTYRLVAVYDNPTGEVIRAGGMAEIGGIVWPREPWPAADPENPEFREDYRVFTRHRAP
ncbi:MAG: hypothetical protein GWN02_30110 [Gemmatimonadetes bacterium]|nr:hypothetical protein [Gemmatimonadota bacterium]